MSSLENNANADKVLISAAHFAKQGDFAQAIVHLKSILAADGEHQIALGMLAAIYAQIGLLDRAMDYYRQSLATHPENLLARFQLGLVQLSAKQPQAALETWRPCLEEPNEFVAHFYSGLALLELDAPEKARALLEQAAADMPQTHPLYGALQNLLRLSH